MSLLRSGVCFTSYPTRVVSSVRMFSSSLSRSKQRLVILGSGWGGYEILRGIDKKRWGVSILHQSINIRAHTRSGEDVTMISPTNAFNFTPLLASCAVGTLEFRCAVEPVSVPVLGSDQNTDRLAFDRSEDTLRKWYASRHTFSYSYSQHFCNRLDCLPGLV